MRPSVTATESGRPHLYAEPTVRPAHRRDLPLLGAIFRAADADFAHLADADSPEARAVDAEVAADVGLSLDAHPADAWVAAAGDRIIGFAAATVRGRHWHLTYLFVRPEWQGRGLGGRLLAALHTAARRRGCDVFTTEPSADARGLRSYLKLGMLPAPPALLLDATDPVFPPLLWQDGLEATALSADDEASLNTVGDIDIAVRGVRRPEDIRRWLSEGATGLLLLDRRSAVPVGYLLLRGEYPGIWRFGPAAAIDPTRTAALIARALHAAAVPPLLAAGFRPTRLAPLLATAPIGRWDRYVFGDLDLP